MSQSLLSCLECMEENNALKLSSDKLGRVTVRLEEQGYIASDGSYIGRSIGAAYRTLSKYGSDGWKVK